MAMAKLFHPSAQALGFWIVGQFMLCSYGRSARRNPVKISRVFDGQKAKASGDIDGENDP